MSLKPICFMVMPYRVKDVPGPARPGVPTTVDCDALWDRVYRPALEALGYQAVRGDSDPSSLILSEMIERLAFADLVLADVTLPNGNVYYEVGLRHVAQETRCVLVAGDWSTPLFDISAFSCIRIPMHDSVISDADASAGIALLQQKIPALRDTRTPYHELIVPGDEARRRGVFRDRIASLDAFQAGARAARLSSDDATRKAAVAALLAETSAGALEIPEVSIELLTLVRDVLGWPAVLEFIETLPTAIRKLPTVEEQRLLALGKIGKILEAFTGLEAFVKMNGETPERLGLMGGRCKDLWSEAKKARLDRGEANPSNDERRWLDAAIEHYERGMRLDLNDFYCSSNLPRLLRVRGEDGDELRAAAVSALVVEQCERDLARASTNPWLRATMLTAAISAARPADARQLLRRIRAEGPAQWQVKTTLKDIDIDISLVTDPSVRAALQGIRDDLAALG